MASANVEIVRLLYAAWERGDFSSAKPFFDPEVEFRPPPEFPDYQVCHGLDEMNRAFRLWMGAWESYRFGSPELVDAGDKVMAVHHQWGKGKDTGVEVQNEVFNVFTLRAGKVARYEMFFKRAAALEAAGLSEQDVRAEPDSAR
jgi:ketosteroid isomerase-like protein